MKVAAYQAPLLPGGSMCALELIRRKIDWCEAEGVEILCSPEAVLGGLADHAPCPADLAIAAENGALAALLSPLASATVTIIVGFTELAEGGRLYNAAAVLHRGAVVGVYRTVHPAIRKSAYAAGDRTPVFAIGGLTFGLLTCNDSHHPQLARCMAAQGATALFVPTNNGLPPEKAEVGARARLSDIRLALENGVWVIRADVVGRTGGLVSFGSSAIVRPDGSVLRAAERCGEDLLVADLG